MRHIFALAPILLLQACGSEQVGPPKDCDVARAQFWDCYDKHVPSGDASGFEKMWYACIPHSEPKIIEGSWATDFEWNAFFKGREPSPTEAFPDSPPTSLAFKAGVRPPASVDGQARLWAMKFMGREETCTIVPDIKPTIFVEEVVEKRLVWEVEGYPTYSFE